MKVSKILFFSTILVLSSSTAVYAQIWDTFTGNGIGEYHDIGNDQFDVAAAGGISGNRGEVYKKWDRTAKAACKGNDFKVIQRSWQSVEYPGILGGIIECKTTKSQPVATQNKASQPHSRSTTTDPSLVQKGGQVTKDVGKALENYGDNNADSLVGKSSKLAGSIYTSIGSALTSDKGKTADTNATGGAVSTQSLPSTQQDTLGTLPPVVERLLSSDSKVRRDAAKNIYHNFRFDNSVLTAVNSELKNSYSVNSRDRYEIDSLAWMCKILGASGNLQYKQTLQEVAFNAPNRKVRKYAKSSLNKMR